MERHGFGKKVGVLLSGGLLLTSLLSGLLLTSCSSSTAYFEKKKAYSKKELYQIKENSFTSLNDFALPSDSLKEGSVSSSYVSAVKDFAFQVSKAQDSFSYAPLNLYNTLDSLSDVAKDTCLEKLDSLLGLDKKTRLEAYQNLYPLDFYMNESGILKMYQSMYFQSGYEVNSAFVSSLADRFTMAYQCDLHNTDNQTRICDWIDETMDEKNFIRKDNLEINEDSMALLVSTLRFDGKWHSRYLSDDSYEESFYNQDGKTAKVNYMKHSAFSTIYDYGDYFSVYDRYQNGETIQFLVSKDKKDLTWDLIKDVNFYKEDETKKMEGERVVSLSVPKFDVTATTDFLPVLNRLGLSELKNKDSHALDDMFDNLDSKDSVYLSMLKQKNVTTFSEDGTMIKSATIAGVGKNSVDSYIDTLELRLDHPFVYTVYDRAGIPIYTARVDCF